jgi:hypothetical protein
MDKDNSRNSQEALPFNDDDVTDWLSSALFYADNDNKSKITERINRLIGSVTELDIENAVIWNDRNQATQNHARSGHLFRQLLAEIYGNIICQGGGRANAHYIAKTMMTNDFPRASQFYYLGDQLDTVRNRMKAGRSDPTQCPGVAGFSESDWQMLDEAKGRDSDGAGSGELFFR